MNLRSLVALLLAAAASPALASADVPAESGRYLDPPRRAARRVAGPSLSPALTLDLAREHELLSRLGATSGTTLAVSVLGGILALKAQGYRPSQDTSRRLEITGGTLIAASLLTALAVTIAQAVRVRRRYRQLRRLGLTVESHRPALALAALMPLLTPWPASRAAMRQHRANREAIARAAPRAW
ncbi:MAG: hypothetical protein AAGH15_02235 [Myxococcota bacterium]